MGDIPQPETIVLPHLFKSQQKHIAAPFALEEASVQVSPPIQPIFVPGIWRSEVAPWNSPFLWALWCLIKVFHSFCSSNYIRFRLSEEKLNNIIFLEGFSVPSMYCFTTALCSYLQGSKQTILRLIESHTPHLKQLVDQFEPFVDILSLSSEDVVAETEQRAAVGSVAEAFKQAILGYHEVRVMRI